MTGKEKEENETKIIIA